MAKKSQELRQRFAAVRIGFTKFGARKALNHVQLQEAAEAFQASPRYLGAAKKLFDTKHPQWLGVVKVFSAIRSYWIGMTLPFPDPGVRLIRQEAVELFNERMQQFQKQLEDAVAALEERYAELRNDAHEKLGTLFNDLDYPPQMTGLFRLDWDFPSVEPPQYLMQLNPQLYAEQQARIAARFDEAARLAEEAFSGEFAKLVGHLAERLSGADGQKKVFRDSAITNLREFFDRFKALKVGTDGSEIEQMMGQVEQMLAGVDPQSLRENNDLRATIAAQLANVQQQLDGMMVDAPRRKILRPAAEQGQATTDGKAA